MEYNSALQAEYGGVLKMEYSDVLKSAEFDAYYGLITEWNKKFNLTSITGREEVFLKHFYDSVLALDFFTDGARILDIGSGAGLPAVALKIANPSLNITMLDSVNKKVGFLNHVIGVLNLQGIKAVHARVEDFKEFEFDFATARALAPLNILLEYSLPFLKVGGRLVAYKSQNVEEEVLGCANALKVLGGTVKEIVYKKLDEETVRGFVIVEKVKKSPEGYPRGLNKPRLKPL